MKPKEVLEKWIDCFNKADAYHIAELYATNAVSPSEGSTFGLRHSSRIGA